MKINADFHIHSRFSRACSTNINPYNIEDTAFNKGINVIGTGDFTHPLWLKEIMENLEPSKDHQGLFKLKNSSRKIWFILSVEVATIQEENGRSKRIHHVVMLPDFESVDSLNNIISKFGNLSSDGRPQLTISADHFVEEVFKVNRNAFVFPAHIWTPFFGALGATTGFNSIKDVYKDQEKHIFALETGLSSDPPMNWLISELDKYTLISNSDMHSLPKMGREMNLFEIDEKDLSYNSIVNAIKEKDSKKLKKTIEFFPEEGKYHFDGHRQCSVSINPETEHIKICPICGKKVVIGVLHRIIDLADRPVNYIPKDAIPYQHLVPLAEVISYAIKKSSSSQAVAKEYNKLILKFNTEFNILVNVDIEKIEEHSSKEIAESISNVRNNKVTIIPGYDGVFGKIDLLNEEKPKPAFWKQKRL
ncbi:MAG: endonuclease Q family protein [Candidatus Marsarchaeota archaeon]|nr:endonuclease Q family protein [Candidatus Marsarchaeota archaeon]